MADSEHNVTININGNANVAVSALGKVKSGLNGILNAGKLAFGFISKINWVVGGIQTVISAFQKLHEWMGRAAEQAKALRHEIASSGYEASIANAAAAYEKLNKKIAQSIKLERERNDILDKRKATERDLEDASLELKKQQEIAALDPMASDYAEKKSAIDRKYASKASEIAESRAGEDSRADASKLYKEADRREKDANDLERQYKQALAREDKAVERNWAAGMAARSGNENDIRRKEETEKQWQEAHDFAVKIKEQMEKAKEEAQSLRTRAGEMAGGDLAAKMRNEATQMAISTKAKEEEAQRKKTEDEKRQNEEKTGKYKIEDATLKRQMAEDLAALDPKSKTYEADRKEIERTYTARAAEDKVARAETDADRKAAEEELAALNIRNTSERRKDIADQELQRADELESFADRAAAADGVSQNRLTAMGLGSGVSANGGVASDVRKLVDLLRQNVKATENINKNGDTEDVAVYGE